MSKVGTAHIEIKPVLNEGALDAIRQRIAQVVEDALALAGLKSTPAARLTRSRRIFHRLRQYPTVDIVTFGQGDDAPRSRSAVGIPVFRLDVESWREMGEPDTITLDITPGDLLNTEESPNA